jgi:hypothetical protein
VVSRKKRALQVARAVSVGTFKVGGAFLKVAGVSAGRGSAWVLTKAAVDPAKRKISDWTLVKHAGQVQRLLNQNRCAGCRRPMRTQRGKFHFCSDKCALGRAQVWSRFYKTPVDNSSDPLSIYFDCGHNKNVNKTPKGTCRVCDPD